MRSSYPYHPAPASDLNRTGQEATQPLAGRPHDGSHVATRFLAHRCAESSRAHSLPTRRWEAGPLRPSHVGPAQRPVSYPSALFSPQTQRFLYFLLAQLAASVSERPDYELRLFEGAR